MLLIGRAMEALQFMRIFRPERSPISRSVHGSEGPVSAISH